MIRLSTQNILNRSFRNATNTLAAIHGQFDTQDYFNAVFDNEKDALRVSLAGGMLPSVESVSELPATAENKQICPVCGEDGKVEFYIFNGGSWTKLDSGGTALSEEERIAVEWLEEHLDEIKDITDFDYAVKEMVITLNPDHTASVNGTAISIADDLDGDDDATTPFKFDVQGYVLGVETFADAETYTSDRYYTRIVYESNGSSAGTSHIYMMQDEFDYFAALGNGRNVLKAYYVGNVFPASMKFSRRLLKLAMRDSTHYAIDESNEWLDVEDIGDTDNDEETVCRLEVAGYALDVEAFYGEEDIARKRILQKMAYNLERNCTEIYFDAASFEIIANFPEGKNSIVIYTIGGIDSKYKVDMELDEASINAVSNKAVALALKEATARIAELERKVAELEG